MVKVECSMRKWWFAGIMSPLSISGDIYGHPEYKEGEFATFLVVRADLANKVVETEDAYIRLEGRHYSPEDLLRSLRRKENN